MATKETTRFMALLAVGAASLVLAGCSLLPGGNSGTGTGDTGTTDEGDDVFSIVVGDCLNDADVAETVSKVPIVDCSEPHDSEAFYAEDLPDVVGVHPVDDERDRTEPGTCVLGAEHADPGTLGEAVERRFADDLVRGVYRTSRRDALGKRFIETNPHALSNLLVVDIDHPDAALRALSAAHHPMPTAVVWPRPAFVVWNTAS